MWKFLTLLMLVLGAELVRAADDVPALDDVAKKEFSTPVLYQRWLAHKNDKQAITRFYDALAEKHVIEPVTGNPQKVTVTYFAKGGPDTDYLMQSGGPDLFGLRFKRFANSDIWFCVQEIPADAWFTYGVNEFKLIQREDAAEIRESVVTKIIDGAIVGPTAPLSPYLQLDARVPKGELREVSLNSKYMGDERKFVVYTPPGYDAKIQHNLVLQFDGQNYVRGPKHGAAWEGWTPMPTILDNLAHAGKLGPTIALFIFNRNRSVDLLNEKMTDFVALELVDWARQHYTISPQASRVIASGPSRAGFAAARTAFRHPDVVGGALSQSGSFYYTLQPVENWPVYPEFEGQLLLDYKRSEKRDIRFYMDVGLYDLGLGAVGTHRQFRDILELKGYTVDYREYKGGHSHFGWRHTFANGLISLLGKSGVQE